jgi:hypothetical protein
MFGPGVAADWGLHLRHPAFPRGVIVAVLVGSLLLGVLPGLWEYARTVAVARHSSSSSARSATKPR